MPSTPVRSAERTRSAHEEKGNGGTWRMKSLNTEAPVIVKSYPTRDLAGGLVDELRKNGIAAAIVPSDQIAGAWDVVVPTSDALRAKETADGLPQGY